MRTSAILSLATEEEEKTIRRALTRINILLDKFLIPLHISCSWTIDDSRSKRPPHHSYSPFGSLHSSVHMPFALLEKAAEAAALSTLLAFPHPPPSLPSGLAQLSPPPPPLAFWAHPKTDRAGLRLPRVEDLAPEKRNQCCARKVIKSSFQIDLLNRFRFRRGQRR